MASISSGKDGRRTVQFVGGDGKRRSIRLGKVPMKNAQEVQRRVEFLVGALATNSAPDLDTAKWLAAIDDDVHGKLAAVGLVEPRASSLLSLEKLIDAYIKSRPDFKPRTVLNMRGCGARIVKFFGANQLIKKITEGKADEFQAWMRANYAQATCARTIKRAKQLFKSAARKGLVAKNVFGELKAGHMSNKARAFIVSKEAAAKVLAFCPDNQWRLLFALARFGGLRTPSESFNLQWADVDWERSRVRIRSPKKESDESAGERVIPLFPELRPHLEEAWDLAEEGATHVITRYRDNSANLRTTLCKIIRRAGLTPWQRPWQNLRLTRQTELAASFPLHIVCAWLGNTTAVAAEHYLQVTDQDYENAAQAVHIPVHRAVHQTGQQASVDSRKDSQGEQKTPENPGFLRTSASSYETLQLCQTSPEGLDSQGASSNADSNLSNPAFQGGAPSGAVGPERTYSDLARLIEAWPRLSEADRRAILAILDRIT